jgi:di/tricarboxylate transporter
MIILPIVQSVAEQLGDGSHAKVLVMASALMCSGAMGLPISGFPNMNAVALEDPTGANYIGSIDFLKVGVPSSILAYGVIVSLGYYLMIVVKY